MEFTLLNVALLVLAIAFGRFLRYNPLIFGMRASSGPPPTAEEFFVYTEHHVLDAELGKFVESFPPKANGDIDEFRAYRNHCLRVLSFALYHLGGTTSVSEKDVNVMALGLAYHDIALWSDNSLDYLEPSVEQLDKQASSLIRGSKKGDQTEQTEGQQKDDKGAAPESVRVDFDENDIATAREIVLQHHKFTPWQQQPKGGKDKSVVVNADLVNAIRKGDWADATLGIIRFGLPATVSESTPSLV